MADSTLDSQLFVLLDRWPGYAHPDSRKHPPNGGIVGTEHHNVATAEYRPGEKIELLNHAGTAGQEGIATMIYLQLGTQNSGSVLAVKDVCVPESEDGGIFKVTNDPDACLVATGAAFVAVALSAMTNQRWGWFWCGGVCPESHVSGLGGNYETDNDLLAGLMVSHDLDADAIGFGPCGGDTEVIVGYTISDDA